MLSRFSVILICLGLLLAAILVYFSGREDYWGDEGFTVRRIEAAWPQVYDPFYCRVPNGADPFETKYVFDFNPPFYFTLIRLVAGPHPTRLQIRLFSIVPVLIVLGLLAGWARREYGDGVALMLALVFCMSPPVLYYGHEARPYALALLVSVLLVYCHLNQPRRPCLVLGISFGLALIAAMTHFHTIWLVLTLIALRGLAAIRDQFRARSLPGLIGLTGGLAAAAILMSPALHILTIAQKAPSRSISFVPVLKGIFLPVAMNNKNWILHGMFYACISLFVLLVVYFLSVSRKPRIHFALWIVPAAGPIMFRILLGQSFFERYCIFATPGWIMLLGWMLAEAKNRSRPIRAVAASLALLMVANSLYWVCVHLRTPFRPTWRPAISAFQAAEKKGDYYSIQPEWLSLCFAANAGRKPNAAYFSNLAKPPSKANRIWVIGRQNEPQKLLPLAQKGWKLDRVNRTGDQVLWLATLTGPSPHPDQILSPTKIKGLPR